MPDEAREITQKTQPKKAGAKPVDIPVPSRREVDDFLKRVTGKRPAKDPKKK